MGKTPNAVECGVKVFAKLSSFRQFFERYKLNDYCDAFVIGGAQVWNNTLNKK